MTHRVPELLVLLQGAVRDAAPVNISQAKEAALAQGFTERDFSRACILLTARGDVVFDRNMELVEPSPENPYYEFG